MLKGYPIESLNTIVYFLFLTSFLLFPLYYFVLWVSPKKNCHKVTLITP